MTSGGAKGRGRNLLLRDGSRLIGDTVVHYASSGNAQSALKYITQNYSDPATSTSPIQTKNLPVGQGGRLFVTNHGKSVKVAFSRGDDVVMLEFDTKGTDRFTDSTILKVAGTQFAKLA